MKQQIEQEAKTVEEAIRLGLESLGLSSEDVSVEILEKEKSGFLGFGSKPAKVRLTVLEEDSFGELSAKPEKTVKKPEKHSEIVEKIETKNESSDAKEHAEQFLKDVFDKMNLQVEVKSECSEKEIRINLTGDEMGAVIGRRGETLDALQYLTSLAVNRSSEEYYKISVDTENYRSEREKTLQNLALRLAEKAKTNRRNVSLEPMNAYERKIIHSTLQNDDMINTYSVGEEPHRKIIISPKNAIRRSRYNNNKSYHKNYYKNDNREISSEEE